MSLINVGLNTQTDCYMDTGSHIQYLYLLAGYPCGVWQSQDGTTHKFQSAATVTSPRVQYLVPPTSLIMHIRLVKERFLRDTNDTSRITGYRRRSYNTEVGRRYIDVVVQ